MDWNGLKQIKIKDYNEFRPFENGLKYIKIG